MDIVVRADLRNIARRCCALVPGVRTPSGHWTERNLPGVPPVSGIQRCGLMRRRGRILNCRRRRAVGPGGSRGVIALKFEWMPSSRWINSEQMHHWQWQGIDADLTSRSHPDGGPWVLPVAAGSWSASHGGPLQVDPESGRDRLQAGRRG